MIPPLMKHQGSNIAYADLRLNELRQARRRILAQAKGPLHFHRLSVLIAESPCSRFWVSLERAATVIRPLLQGKPMPYMRPIKQQMYIEILRRVRLLIESCPSITVTDAIASAIDSPAPRFYLSPRTVYRLLHP